MYMLQSVYIDNMKLDRITNDKVIKHY